MAKSPAIVSSDTAEVEALVITEKSTLAMEPKTSPVPTSQTAESDVATPVAAPALLAEADDDHDSSYEAESVASSTASITSSMLKYRKENGRSYHAYKDGQYLIPNDDSEMDRMDLQHQMWTLTLDGKLYLAPLAKKSIHRVLDIGTGTGIWAIDFADDNPESVVLGIDLSSIQPGYVPPNLHFQVDDADASWTHSNKFDFIHSRMMAGSLINFPRMISRAFDNLNAGGWLEMVDITHPMRVNDGAWPQNSALWKWHGLMTEGAAKAGINVHQTDCYKDNMIAAGFVNVVEATYHWPNNQWPKDRKLKELGMWRNEDMLQGIEAISLAIFTRFLGWSPLELQVLLAHVRNEIKDRSLHSYWDVKFVYGQKPE